MTDVITGTHTSLYRLRDSKGALLYVGIAGNPGRRFEQHRKEKEWWGEVASIVLEHFDTRESAAVAERDAIRLEQPRYNKTHRATRPQQTLSQLERRIAEALDVDPRPWNGPYGTWDQAVEAARIAAKAVGNITHSKPTQIDWRCTGCRASITNGDGYIEILWCEIAAYQQHLADWEQRNPGPRLNGAALLDLPMPVKWQRWHRACDPYPEAGSYWIAVERIRTYPELLDWTAHLSEKDWLQHTNWPDVLRSVNHHA